jgi:hypothetical protein
MCIAFKHITAFDGASWVLGARMASALRSSALFHARLDSMLRFFSSQRMHLGVRGSGRQQRRRQRHVVPELTHGSGCNKAAAPPLCPVGSTYMFQATPSAHHHDYKLDHESKVL